MIWTSMENKSDKLLLLKKILMEIVSIGKPNYKNIPKVLAYWDFCWLYKTIL